MSKRLSLFSLAAGMILIAAMLMTTSCQSSVAPASTSTASPIQSATAQPTQPPQTSEAPAKILKIGAVINLQIGHGVDTNKGMLVIADMYNKKGGIVIGGEKYQVQAIIYDNQANPGVAASAANRLIFEDGVKFITADADGTDAVTPLAEANKILFAAQALSPAIFNPKYKYSYNTGATFASGTTATGWLGANYPGKTIVTALPDNQIGHMIGMLNGKGMAAFGLSNKDEYYPATATDLSALGTRVKSLNPDIFCTTGGSDDSVTYKAILQSGWKGTIFAFTQNPSTTLLQGLTPEDLNCYLGPAISTDFDPALSQYAGDYKAAWIEKYGKWDNPDVTTLASYCAIFAAIEKADSIDVDKVAQVIADGLSWDSPASSFKSIPRTDMGITRCVDSVISFNMMKMTDGVPEVIGDIPLNDSEKYYYKVYPPK
jgi:branched-chain amino acid transport system substrate-binding protein